MLPPLSGIQRALRSLARTPGLSLAAIATLALGAGSTIAIGTIVYSILWRPLPGMRSDRLAVVYPTERGALDGESDALSLAEAEAVEASGAVDALALLTFRNLTLTGGEPERVLGASVSTDFFQVLGMPMLVGRGFQPDEGRDFGLEESAVLSHGLWQRRFGGDPAAVGRAIEINQRALTVVGVLPAGVGIPSSQQIYLPWRPAPGLDRGARNFWTVAVLAGGRAPRDLQPALDAATGRMRNAGIVTDDDRGFRLVPIRESLYDPHAERISVVLSTLAFALLAVACFNVANLLFARAASREGEIAVRLALGARRSHVVTHVLSESLVLAAAGCAAGLVLGKWGLDLGLATLREEFPAWMTFAIDSRLVLATCGLALAVTLLAGLAPALGAGRSGLSPLLTTAARGSADRRTRRLQRLLVGIQFAASYLVLAGGWWLLGSVRALESTPIGFDPAPLLSLRTYLPGDAYDPDEAKLAFRQQLVERLSTLPGVASAAVTTALPADDGGETARVSPADAAPGSEGSLVVAVIGTSRGFFDTLGARMVSGEMWTAGEDAGAPLLHVVVNRALADKLWPGEPALGQRLRLGTHADDPVYTVSGLAPEIPIEELHEQTVHSRDHLFVPFARFAWRTSFVIVRAAEGDPAALSGPVRGVLSSIEPDAPVFDLLTYRARLRQSWEDRRLIGHIASLFAAQGLVLAAVGLFGVLAFAVARRRREIGIRMAVGATPGGIVRRIVGDGLRFSAPGVVAGLLLTLAVARTTGGVLYGVDPQAPIPLLLALAVLLAVASAASSLAARRASGIDPAAALRED